MNMRSIDEIYETNRKIRNGLLSVLDGVSSTRLSTVPPGEKWNVLQTVEHVSMVSDGAVRICSRLLSKAPEAGPEHAPGLSPGFIEKTRGIGSTKLEAPDIVQPTGERTLDESLAALERSIAQMEELRDMFRTRDTSGPKFPHPYFGDLSALEWFVLSGAHEKRHTDQIIRILSAAVEP